MQLEQNNKQQLDQDSVIIYLDEMYIRLLEMKNALVSSENSIHIR